MTKTNQTKEEKIESLNGMINATRRTNRNLLVVGSLAALITLGSVYKISQFGDKEKTEISRLHEQNPELKEKVKEYLCLEHQVRYRSHPAGPSFEEMLANGELERKLIAESEQNARFLTFRKNPEVIKIAETDKKIQREYSTKIPLYAASGLIGLMTALVCGATYLTGGYVIIKKCKKELLQLLQPSQ